MRTGHGEGEYNFGPLNWRVCARANVQAMFHDISGVGGKRQKSFGTPFMEGLHQ